MEYSMLQCHRICGLVLGAEEFVGLGIIDVEAAVGAALSPLIFIVTLKKIKGKGGDES